ncbi:alpha/beta-hydrolase [Daldinia grandis]|nr:alpha/beta-hydrolase [Daldinia grandis]
MYDYLPNPALIYQGPALPRAPLILIHDGGGTNFNYHLLNQIGRPLWGLANARLHEGGWWEGGIPQMATYYVGLLSKAIPEGGDILLGGWSLGGLLSLEMAHRIAVARRDGGTGAKFRVKGMVFIDSLCPSYSDEMRARLPAEPVVLSAQESEAMKLKEKVNLNMTHARIMVSFWDLPRWEDGLQAPPTIILRAKEWFSRDPSKSFVDFTREDRLLGWGNYNEEHGSFIKDIVDVEGHHFSIFNFDYLDDVTRKVRAAADQLDPLGF